MKTHKEFTSAFAREVHRLNRRECRECGCKFTPENVKQWDCDDCERAVDSDLSELDFDGYMGYDDWK